MQEYEKNLNSALEKRRVMTETAANQLSISKNAEVNAGKPPLGKSEL
jgi:hypothetical protein